MPRTRNPLCGICGAKREPSGAICKREETKRHRNGTLWSLSVDHDHDTGAVRALLCSACNVGLSNFREDTESLTAAVEYSQFHATILSTKESL